MKQLLILTPKKGSPSKVLNKKLEKVSSFSAGFMFSFETKEYLSFHDVIKTVMKRNDCFICLGELTEYGKELEENNELGPRRKKKGNPTIQDRIGNEIVLDLDDHIIKGFDALNPVPSITKWLKKKNIYCDVTWQITSSQQLNTNEARIRLYFESESEHDLIYRKAYSQSSDIQADGSVYTCSQPIYTAHPTILKNKPDPIKIRSGFIKGTRRKHKLPKLTKPTIDKYASFNRGGEVYDYTDSTLPDEVLNGSVYRRYFMPLAFHYANLLKGDREAIFQIIHAKSLAVTSRIFDADNTYDYIDDAIQRIKEEKELDSELLKAEDIKDLSPSILPDFPNDILDTWPEPWPMIWKNFKKIPRELEPALLIPTILSLNAYFLRGNYVTSYNRRPNLLFLNLTPSTGNKDVNSKNVIRDLDAMFKKKGAKTCLFSNILNTESSITADISFLNSFSDTGELFWINTEATRIFQQIKTSGAVSSVAALSDKLIELVDGHEITGKVKAGGKTKTIQDPNAQVLFYAQPETIERFIDEDMVDSGLFGRALLSIIPELKFDKKTYSMFLSKNNKKIKISDEFYDFYTSQKFNMSNMSAGKTVLTPPQKSLELMDDWARETVAELMEDNDVFQKVLSRIGNAAEQLYVIVLGICQLYDAHMEQDIRKNIPIGPLLPMLEYWAETKVYAIDNFVNSSLDPLADSILEIISDCLSGKVKMMTAIDKKLVEEHNMVARSQVFRIMKNRIKLIRKLSADGDRKNATVNAMRIMEGMIRHGVLKEKLIIGKECVGIQK